jgi:hypothetical protein
MIPLTVQYETIYAGLFALIENAYEFRTTTRWLQHWVDVPAVNQPYMAQCQSGEHWIQRKGLPPRVTLRADLWIYCYAQQGTGSIPSQQMNEIRAAIDQVFQVDELSTNTCTLGGLVSHAWIEGEVLTDEGLLGPQCAMKIPVNILVDV